MLRRATTALARSTDVTGTLVVGGLLTLSTWIVLPLWLVATLTTPPAAVAGPFVLTPALVVRGYFVRILADGIENGNAEGAASFVAWNDLYRDGVRSLLVSAVLLAPLAVLLATAAVAAAALRSASTDLRPITVAIEGALGPSGSTAIAAAAVGLLGVLTAAYLLAYAYVRPAALAAFAASGRLRDGLRPSRIVRVAGSGRYAAAWVVATATLVAGYALAGPLALIVIGSVVVFAVRAIAHGVYGRGARDALSGHPAGPSGITRVGSGDDSRPPPAVAARGAPASTGTSYRSSRSLGDGGSRSRRIEASPAVQSGRTVPIRRRESADGPGDPRDESEGGDGQSETVDAGFEWVSADRLSGGKDKS
ncbi:DUF4013 domain-containing protein [Halorubrum sp. SD626R]|uniref:DUF4013 domain-containing protein n=1 Tax=Halorubrum TaxID=56688 RepID=UPI0010F73579|nr:MULTISPECIES: DUF4013 domain-containing protein [Halorubrum]TKX79142.1 DUF4013 domain-containing protein [Halorubrum sp. SD626R]